MVIKLSQEKYRIADKMFLIYGIESEEFDVAVRNYGLEADQDDDTSEIRLDDFVLKKFND